MRVAHVIRDGVESKIPAADLVPGDVVVLAAGARVPADGRVIECARLQIEEAALTGESLAVMKTFEVLEEKDAALGDRINMAFLGTTLIDGRGRLVVTATGAQTEMGKIGTLSAGSGWSQTLRCFPAFLPSTSCRSSKPCNSRDTSSR